MTMKCYEELMQVVGFCTLKNMFQLLEMASIKSPDLNTNKYHDRNSWSRDRLKFSRVND